MAMTRTHRLMQLVRRDGADISTAEGRSLHRDRRIALTIAGAFFARGISILTGLISIPLTVQYLGTERYGLWMTIISVQALLGFADLGMGRGLVNAIAVAHGRNDRDTARESVSSAFFLLCGVAIFLGGGFLVAYPAVPWPEVFNVTSPKASDEAGPAIAIFVGCSLASMPLGIVRRIQAGYQEGFRNNLWMGVASLLGLVGVLVAIKQQAGLPWLVLAFMGAPLLALALNGAFLFGVRYPWLRPAWRHASRGTVRAIFGAGLLFLIVQIARIFTYSSDTIIIAQLLGPDAVTQYSVPARLFIFMASILDVSLVALWPAYGESIARNDFHWVRKTLGRSMVITWLMIGLPSLVLLLFGTQVLHFWVGDQINPSLSLLLGLGVWTVLNGVGKTVNVFLNVASLRFQASVAVLTLVAAIPTKIVLTEVLGLSGIVWGTICAYFLMTLVPYIIHVPRVLERLERNGTEAITNVATMASEATHRDANRVKKSKV